jgi:transcriptional regulator with XRE-family HTH domain
VVGFNEQRTLIGRTLRRLRDDRGLSQAELANELAMSQPRLSQIERGHASLTAEQLIVALRFLNASIDDFAVKPARDPRLLAIQNALVRLGAKHLRTSTKAVISEDLTRPEDLVVAGLQSNSPRLITALAPVLFEHGGELDFARIAQTLDGFEQRHRLYWLLENVIEAIELWGPLAASNARRSAAETLERALAFGNGYEIYRAGKLDFLERTYRRIADVETAFARGTPIAQRWRIVTALRPADFAEALRESHGED